MRYFVCAFELIKFGIPAEFTESIIQLTRTQNSTIENVDNNVYVSLPALFQKYSSTPHGVILKLSVSNSRKITLLTPQIEKDMEIPENNVHGLPQLLTGPYAFFSGVFFSNENPVFIFNPEKLAEKIK